jgi:hypothetical protein
MARGLDAGKYFWRSGREKCFSLDIPFYRTFPQPRRRVKEDWTNIKPRSTPTTKPRSFTQIT